MKSIGITALGICLPKDIRTNDYYINHPSEAVRSRVGVGVGKIWNPLEHDTDPFSAAMGPYANDPFRGCVQRRTLPKGQRLLDLEVAAARNALNAANVSPDAIEAIIVTSMIPDFIGAGNAAYLAKELQARCPAWNLESACSSGVVALEVAYAYIASGRYSNVLVVQGCNYTQNADDEDSSTWFLGDGAGAFLVSTVPEGYGFKGFHVEPTTATCGVVNYKVNGPDSGKPCFTLESAKGAGKVLHETSEPYLVKCCDKALGEAGMVRADVDFAIFSTPTAWYADFCTRALGMPNGRTVCTHREFGNMGPAMTPVTLYAALKENKIRVGDDVLMYQVGSVSNAGAVVMKWAECQTLATTY